MMITKHTIFFILRSSTFLGSFVLLFAILRPVTYCCCYFRLAFALVSLFLPIFSHSSLEGLANVSPASFVALSKFDSMMLTFHNTSCMSLVDFNTISPTFHLQTMMPTKSLY